MATEKPKLYVYFGRVPTNVCWNGCSFPVMPGEAIQGYEALITAHIDPKVLREVPLGSQKARHTFGHQPFFIKRDPTGGLPVRSSTDPNAFKDKTPKPVLATSPALLEESMEGNPYDLGLDEAGNPTDAKTTITTFQQPAEEVKANPEGEKVDEEVVVVTTPFTETVADVEEADPEIDAEGESPDFVITDDNAEVIEDEEEDNADVIFGDDEPVVELAGDQGPKYLPTRTELRKLNVEDLREKAIGVANAECPLKPEMLDAFQGFDEETTKGVMFVAMWTYFGFDEKE